MQGFRLEPSSLNDLESHDNLLQSPFWARVKGTGGSVPLAFSITSDQGQLESALSGESCDRVTLLALVRNLPGPANLSFAYVPHGPDIAVAKEDRQLLQILIMMENQKLESQVGTDMLFLSQMAV